MDVRTGEPPHPHQQMSPPVSLLNLSLTLFFSPSPPLCSAVCPHILWIFMKPMSEFLSGRGRRAWCCVSAFWLQLCLPFALNLSRFFPSSHMRSVQKYTGTGRESERKERDRRRESASERERGGESERLSVSQTAQWCLGSFGNQAHVHFSNILLFLLPGFGRGDADHKVSGFTSLSFSILLPLFFSSFYWRHSLNAC